MTQLFVGAVLISATSCMPDLSGASCVTSADCPSRQTCVDQGAKRTCQFVDGGTTDAGTEDAGVDAGTNPPFRAFALSLQAAALPVACFKSGVLPSGATVPARTIEVLIWSTASGRQFIALPEFGVVQLGDAPAIRAPAAVEGRSGAFQTLTTVQVAVTDQYTESRGGSARFVFADQGATTTGTLELQAQYACINARASCPTGAAAPADAVSCGLTIPFTAQELPLTAKWTAPADPMAGAEKYLVALDPTPLTHLTLASCWRNGNLPPGQGGVTTTNGRALEIWQVFDAAGTRTLRTPHQAWQLGSAPTITVSADLGDVAGTFVRTTTQQTPMGGAWVESRSTRMSVPGFAGAEAATHLELQSQYACLDGTQTCPVGNLAPADAASCQVTFDDVMAVKMP